MSEQLPVSPVEAHFCPDLANALEAVKRAEPDLPLWKRPKDWPKVVGKFLWTEVIKDPIVMGNLLALTLGPGLENQIAAQSGETYNWLHQVNSVISSSPAGKYALEMLAHASVMVNPDINSSEASMVQLAQMLNWLFTFPGSLYTGGKFAIPRAVEKLTKRREIAIREGKEPLKKNEFPDRVIIGPTGLVSDFTAMREVQDRLVVAIHNGEGIPAALGETLDCHFPISDFSRDLKSPRLIKESGMNRTRQLTFLCINPNNGIFYGEDSQPALLPNSVSSVLRSLPPDQLRGLQVDVLLSKGFDFLGKTTALVEEFSGLQKEFGVEIRWRYLEDVVMDEFRAVIEEFKIGKKADETIKILLVGEGKTEKDKKMLIRFSQALTALDDKVNVTLVDNESIGNIDPKVSDDKRIKYLEELLRQSDLNIVYGDTDDGTTEVAELLIKVRSAERNQTVSILESMDAVTEARRANLLVLSLYQRAINSLK